MSITTVDPRGKANRLTLEQKIARPSYSEYIPRPTWALGRTRTLFRKHCGQPMLRMWKMWYKDCNKHGKMIEFRLARIICECCGVDQPPM